MRLGLPHATARRAPASLPAFDERARRAAVARALERERQAARIIPQPAPRSRFQRVELLKLLPPGTPMPAALVGDHKPLAIGILAALANMVAPENIGKLRRWLEGYVRRPEYLAAVAAPGSRRMNLDGSDAGPVAEAHRVYAAKLIEKEASRARKK